MARNSCSTPQAFGRNPECPGTVDRHRGHSDLGPIRPGQQVDPAGRSAQALVARDCWSTMPPSDPSAIRPGELVEHAGNRTQVRVTRVSRLNTRAFRPGPESRGIVGRPRGQSDPGPSRPGLLVEHADPRNYARVVQESCSNAWVFGSGAELPGQLVDTEGPRTRALSPGTAIRPREPSDLGWSRLGWLLKPQGLGQGRESPKRVG